MSHRQQTILGLIGLAVLWAVIWFAVLQPQLAEQRTIRALRNDAVMQGRSPNAAEAQYRAAQAAHR